MEIPSLEIQNSSFNIHIILTMTIYKIVIVKIYNHVIA